MLYSTKASSHSNSTATFGFLRYWHRKIFVSLESRPQCTSVELEWNTANICTFTTRSFVLACSPTPKGGGNSRYTVFGCACGMQCKALLACVASHTSEEQRRNAPARAAKNGILAFSASLTLCRTDSTAGHNILRRQEWGCHRTPLTSNVGRRYTEQCRAHMEVPDHADSDSGSNHGSIAGLRRRVESPRC